MPPPNPPWLPYEIDELMQLWPNYSASQIGTMLGRTRNAIIGKIHRLSRTIPIANGQKLYLSPTQQRRPGTPKPKPEVMTVEPTVEQPVLRVDPTPDTPRSCTIYQLNDKRCKWPLGELGPVATHYCGARTVEGRPYCAPHCHAAYYGFADEANNR